MYFTSNDGSQNMFIYQPTLNMLEFKKAKGTYYVLSWKSKGVDTSKLKPLCTAFLHSIKLSGYKMGIKFDKDPLAVEQNIFASKIVSVYIVYNLDARPKNPTNNFKFKNCQFAATNTVKNNNKEKRIHSGYGTTFDNEDSWNFDDDFARKVITFGADNNS